MNPGSMSSADRTAPPYTSWASSTTTDQPRSASRLAATRPFGPAPMTTASGIAASLGGAPADADRGAGAGTAETGEGPIHGRPEGVGHRARLSRRPRAVA